MNERDLAERFGHDVDQLLRGAPVADSEAPDEYQRTLVAARALATLDLGATSAARHRLRARLLARACERRPLAKQAEALAMRALPIVLSLLALVAALLLMSPGLPVAPPERVALTATAPALGTAATAGTPRASALPGTPAPPTPPRPARGTSLRTISVATVSAGVTAPDLPRGP